MVFTSEFRFENTLESELPEVGVDEGGLGQLVALLQFRKGVHTPPDVPQRTHVLEGQLLVQVLSPRLGSVSTYGSEVRRAVAEYQVLLTRPKLMGVEQLEIVAVIVCKSCLACNKTLFSIMIF